MLSQVEGANAASGRACADRSGNHWLRAVDEGMRKTSHSVVKRGTNFLAYSPVSRVVVESQQTGVNRPFVALASLNHLDILPPREGEHEVVRNVGDRRTTT